MPFHFDDLDVVSRVSGLSSALIVPCTMCPAVTVAIRENKPFMQFFKLAPFAAYIKKMRSALNKKGVRTRVFRSFLYHQWFMCIWTARRRNKLLDATKGYDAVIVLGCESATETVRACIQSTDCKVIEGMKTVGITNAQPRLRLPCHVYFRDCRIVPLPQQN
ncbi:MAG: hypothetical protein ACYTEU_08190 [Planctomycetota bacterium]|jgi:hypothetical protein